MRILLTIFFFALVFFYLLQWAVRVVLRWKINSIQREMAQKSGRNHTKRPPKEGEVRVDTGAPRGRKINERIGDYVEYEEITATEEDRQTQP